VVGNSGSGKTFLSRRLAELLDVPHVELDAIHHLADWEPIDPENFLREIDTATTAAGWVVDGNYSAVVMDGPVWRRADTVVWVDPPRRTVMYQVVTRTVRRAVHRELLWNGNREPWWSLFAWDPHESIIRWAWTQHSKYRQRYSAAMRPPAYSHLDFVRLRRRTDIESWLGVVAKRTPGEHPAPG